MIERAEQLGTDSDRGGSGRTRGHPLPWNAVSDDRNLDTEDPNDAEDAARRRAKRRANWPIERRSLHDPEPSLLHTTTAAERLAMMWPLAVEAWAMAGKPIPDFKWPEAPVRIFQRKTRRTGPEPDTAT